MYRMDIEQIGSIPACAGEPARDGKAQWLAEVYPRLCGGTVSKSTGFNRGSGLSPPVRGNQGALPLCQLIKGSIPACAGEPRCNG